MTAQVRALVTGGAGFIGSHLVDALLARGSSVTVLDDLSTGNVAHLTTHDGDKRFNAIRGSVLDSDLVTSLVRAHDIVYHLAAAVGVRHIVADPLAAMLTNVRGSEIVLSAAFDERVPVLLASTSEIYGKSTAYPFREDGDRVLGSTSVHRWSYSTAKAIDEHLAFAYAEKGLAVSIVRYFNSYGPRIDSRGYGSVIARFAAQALAGEPMTVHGDGGQSRCFTYVADTVRGTLLAAGAARQGKPVVYNIGSREEVTIGELAALVREILGSRSEVVRVPYEDYYGSGFEDTRRRIPDTQRASADLGFTAEVALRDGLARTLAWCRDTYGIATSS